MTTQKITWRIFPASRLAFVWCSTPNVHMWVAALWYGL